MYNDFKKSIIFRFLKSFSLVIFIPILIIELIHYSNCYMNEKTMMQNSLICFAQGASVLIDPLQLAQAELEKSNNSHAYQAVHDPLSAYKNKINARFVYTLKKDGNQTRIIVDGEEVGSKNFCNIEEPYYLTAPMEKAFSGQASVTEKPYTDQWGTVLSAYAPILDTDGSVQSVVGVDIEASKLTLIKQQLLFRTSLFIICYLLIISFLAYYFWRKFDKQSYKLRQALLQAGEGDFSIVCPEEEGEDYEEIRILQNSFNNMIDKIKILMNKSQESSRLKSEFMSTMSHELRTPLNSIIGYTHLVLTQAEDTLSPKHRKHLQTVERNGQHLLGLINQMLDLSAIEAGKKDLVVEKFDCVELIEEVIALALPLAHKKNLTLKNTSVEKEMTIYSDRQKLLQILINLTGNAIKFTKKGTIKLKAESLVLEDGTPSINILVSDTGIGIRPQDIGSIFEPFRQIDGSLTRQEGGTGLGLYLTQKICGLLKGKITVESTVNEGTTFCCSINPKLNM